MNKPTKNPLHYFTAKAGGDILTLDIMDEIGESMFGDGITASAVSDALKGSFATIILNINSPGGNLYDGVGIYNALKATGKPVSVNVVGLCASAASLVAMAGDSIIMRPGSTMMCHNAMGVAMGNADDMRKMGDVLDTVTASAADLYVARTGLSKNKVLAYMQAETWFSPQEAVEAGFATAVSKESAIKNSFDLSAFRNVPETLKNTKEEVVPETLKPVKAEAATTIVPEPVVDPAVEVVVETEPAIVDKLPLLSKQVEINRRK